MLPIELAVQIFMAVIQLKSDEYVTIPDMLMNFTNDNNDESILGTLHITDFIVNGFESITNEITNIDVTEDEDENNNACMYIPIGYLQLTTKYVADIGIDNEIPIYGDGKLLFKMNNIELNVCAFFNFNERYVDQVVTTLSWRHSPVEFSGLWKNNEASELLETFLNIANRFFAMWSAYEPQWTGCLVSPFIEYLLNGHIENENSEISFQNMEACLQGILIDDSFNLSDYEKLKEYLLSWMQTEKDAKSVKDFLDDDNTKDTIEGLISPVAEIVKTMFNKNGSKHSWKP